MFNGHMDTSYSGREPWLGGKGFKPEARVEGDYIFGLGISNMKGALACYVEAVRALQEAGVRLRGDVLIAAVVGEIEKTQWGDEFRGKEYRGYAAGSRYLVTHGGVADMCLLGEPTEGQASCSATTARSGCGSRRAGRSCTRRSAVAARRRTRSCGCGGCSTRCSSGSPTGRTRDVLRGPAGRRQRRRGAGRLPLARVADARAAPTSSWTSACRRRCRWRRPPRRARDWVRALAGAVPGLRDRVGRST